MRSTKKIRRINTLLFIIVIFILGLIIGYIINTLITIEKPITFGEDFWGNVGKVILFLFLGLVPLGYFLWLILGMSQLTKPKLPSPEFKSDLTLQNIDQIERILIPVGDGPNVLLGLQLVAQVTGTHNGRITLLRIIPPSSSSSIDDQTKIVRNLAHQSLLDVRHNFELEVKIEISSDIIQTIIDTTRSGNYDLLVVGASERTHVGSFLFGTIPYRLAELSPCPVVIVRSPISQ